MTDKYDADFLALYNTIRPDAVAADDDAINDDFFKHYFVFKTDSINDHNTVSCMNDKSIHADRIDAYFRAYTHALEIAKIYNVSVEPYRANDDMHFNIIVNDDMFISFTVKCVDLK